MRKQCVLLIILVILLIVLAGCGEKNNEIKTTSNGSTDEVVIDAPKKGTIEGWLIENDALDSFLSSDGLSDISGNTLTMHSTFDIDTSTIINDAIQDLYITAIEQACGTGSDLEKQAMELIETVESAAGVSGAKLILIFDNEEGEELYIQEYLNDGAGEGKPGKALSQAFSGGNTGSSKPSGNSSSIGGTTSSTTSFTNEYGTPTTKCAHYGCNNYIASSGDTNCCTIHSNKCLECGKYIDEDATWCMDCLSKAASGGSSSSSGSSSSGSSYGSSGSSSSSTEKYPCMGKNDTCPNYTYNPYDLYCSSCDPDGDNIEG